MIPYEDFIRAKVSLSKGYGFDIADEEVHPLLKPHQRVAVRWAVKGGRRALFDTLPAEFPMELSA